MSKKANWNVNDTALMKETTQSFNRDYSTATGILSNEM